MVRFLRTIKSLCPKCANIVCAEVILEEETVYLLKKCPEHGNFKFKHPWSDIRHYDAAHSLNNGRKDCVSAEGLVINLNSTCNQNCPFCFAVANEHPSREPSLGEIEEKINNFKGSFVYLCGGEPTLRKDLFEIISLVRKRGFKVFLFTNGKRLVDTDYVRLLKKCGLHMVILQFDTFDEGRSRLMRGEELVRNKTLALKNLRKVNIPAYLFIMLVKAVNLDEIGALFRYAIDNSDLIKIINFNPVWELGRLSRHEELDASEVLKEIENKTTLKFQDFYECTLFSHYFFELIRKIGKKGGRRQPMCELRCYIVDNGHSSIPLNKILRLKEVNEYLRELNLIFTSRCGFKKQLKILSKSASLFFSILSSGYNIKLSARCLLKIALEKFGMHLKPDILSVIVGTFHTAKTIDFDMVDTCNLYSDSEQGNISSCLRQIYYLKNLTLPDV